MRGSAADVVLCAMVKCEQLKRLGFELVLQIHDELVLEGPLETAEEALRELTELMEDPLPFKLQVPLTVSAKILRTWQK